jgi:hypothetical protein
LASGNRRFGIVATSTAAWRASTALAETSAKRFLTTTGAKGESPGAGGIANIIQAALGGRRNPQRVDDNGFVAAKMQLDPAIAAAELVQRQKRPAKGRDALYGLANSTGNRGLVGRTIGPRWRLCTVDLTG